MNEQRQVLLSVAEVAEMLSVSVASVRRYIKRGDLDAWKANPNLMQSRFLVDKASVVRLLEQRGAADPD